MNRAATPSGSKPALDEPWHDPVYRNLMASRDADALRNALQQAHSGRGAPEIESAQLLQCHYKPFARARMVFAVNMSDSSVHLLSLFLYAVPERAVAKHRSAPAATRAGSQQWSPILLSDWSGVGWWLPDAPNLDAIGVCFDRTVYRRFLAEQGFPDADRPLPELVRYVPRQRALFRCSSAAPGGIYIKCYRPPQDAQAAANLAATTQAW